LRQFTSGTQQYCLLGQKNLPSQFYFDSVAEFLIYPVPLDVPAVFRWCYYLWEFYTHKRTSLFMLILFKVSWIIIII